MCCMLPLSPGSAPAGLDAAYDSLWQLAAGVLFLATAGSLGIPSLTANRAGTLLWFVLGLLVCARATPNWVEGLPGFR
jgi:hypothetical protein